MKGVTSSGPTLLSKIETSLGQLMKLIKVSVSSDSIYTEMFPRIDDFVIQAS